MSKSYRIRTQPGENGYLKVNLDLNQNYDFLEVLSLKISQTDEYEAFCSEYGVIAGRIDINGGFGVPNAKVSIFVPLDEADLEDPVISSLYPYGDLISDPDQRNTNGLRYNLLSSQQQKLDHTPVGSFPTKREVLENGTTLEIYEKYYKYTTTTNDAGDYILFGVPVGEHTIHYDVDVSDIGFVSARPYELIADGYSEELFDSRFKFKSSSNLNSLPQIFTVNERITVEPYWCDSLSSGSPLGINRKDFSIDLNLTPTAIFTGSIFSDDEKDSLNKNCRPDRDMGKMSEVITGGGTIEALRRTQDGKIEKFEVNGEAIDENGNWSILIPMNLRKVITDEFGNLIPSPDGIKGIATEADFRFRISMDKSDSDKRLRQRAKFLVPNLTGNYNFKEYSKESLENSEDFKINTQLSTITTNTPYETEKTNEYNYLEEFYTFRWKKVYTVKQYIGRFQKVKADESRAFVGIKNILDGEGVNKFPSNRTDTNFNPIYTILCFILGLFANIVGIINAIIQVINGLVTMLCQVKIPIGICASSTKGSRYKLEFRREKRECLAGVCIWSAGSDQKKSHTGVYEPLTDFTGNNNSKDGGDFDESLGNCNDTRSFYPSLNQVPQKPQSEGGGPTYKWYTSISKSDGTGTRQMDWSDWIWSNGDRKDWQYPIGCSSGTSDGKCERWRLKEGGNWRNSIKNCDKQNISTTCDGIKIFGTCFQLKFKCILSGLLCKKCKGYCDGSLHSCCPSSNYAYECPDNSAQCGSSSDCCNNCCIKIPLIKLRCAEEDIEISPTLFPTPFGGGQCNKTWVIPGTCLGCGGPQTPFIKDWVACVLEPVAVWLKMLKFDFYNDWVGGSLYFPLVKRKFKLKTSKKKFGQIKKDKFCQFNCDDPQSNTEQFQGDGTYSQNAIRLSPPTYGSVDVTVSGCNARIESPIISEWYGDDTTNATENKDKAAKEIILNGKNNNDENCQIKFDDYNTLNTVLSPINGLTISVLDREGASIYAKPNYVKVTDQFGNETWENQGGYGLNKNKCDRTRMVERGEFFKTTLDCITTQQSATDGGQLLPIEPGTVDFEEEEDPNNPISPTNEPCLGGCTSPPKLPTTDDVACCGSPCGSNGVAGCNAYCPCSNNIPQIELYRDIMRHGLITWSDREIYYSSIIPSDDSKFNSDEYKANLMLPTTIMELGSTSYCDIDGVPFIMNTLQPTTFQVSYESVKYKYNNGAGTENDPIVITSVEDKEGSLNLRGYVSFSCTATECLNSLGIVNQSQIGVELIDTNDIDVEIGNCYLRFDHDVDVREYFCRRFTGYKDDTLGVHYVRPGGNDLDNTYSEYPEIKLVDSYDKYYKFDGENTSIFSEYNDGDLFVPGDACGFNKANQVDYFYGLAPGMIDTLVDFPNTTTLNFPSNNAFEQEVDTNNIGDRDGIRFNRSQTPYHLYFGLVPGKTSLHKTVGKFFADKINSVTLQGLGASPDETSANEFGRNNIRNQVDSPYSILKTCLGQTQLPNPPIS